MVIKGRFGYCIIGDCIKGMDLLIEREYNLNMTITDPPYNVKYETYRKNGQDYADSMDVYEYEYFSKQWIDRAKMLTDFQVFTCGYVNFAMWCRLQPPKDWLVWYVPNTQTRGGSFHVLAHEPILIYGKINNKYTKSVFRVVSKWGFIRDPTLESLIHPTPKQLDLWTPLILQQKPTSVLDCFLGSGTTAEICEANGIKWVGFERDERFISDIEFRINRGMTQYKQRSKSKNLGDL